MRRRHALGLAALLLPLFWPAALPAQAGELTFTPERPRAGQEVDVAYRASAALSGRARVELRARLRTAEAPEYNYTLGSSSAATLYPDAEGVYRGTFSLPDSVVYAAFAVEDTAASVTDSREGRFWEFMAHDTAGRPRVAALEQRLSDHMGRDLRVVLETARRMVRVYPDRVRGWILLGVAQNWTFGDGEGEQRRSAHRDRVAHFDSELAEWQELGVDQVAFMARYARQYGEEEVTERWERRWAELQEKHPGDFFAVQDRLMDAVREHRDQPEALLQELESLWEVTTNREARRMLANRGFWTARKLEEAPLLLRWAERYRDFPPGLSRSPRLTVFETLLSTEATRSSSVASAREEVERLLEVPEEDRRLGETRAEHRKRSVRSAARIRTALGEALLAEGRTKEGLAALERAAAVGWEPDRFRALGEARLEAGDRAVAREAFAAFAADPGTSTGTADSLRQRLGLERSEWEEAVRGMRAEMVERTLATARENGTGAPEVVTEDGSRIELDDRLGEKVTVVVIWSRYCGPSHQAMPRIADLSEELADEGIPLLAVTGDAPEEAREYLDEEGWELEVLFDVEGQVKRALNSWGTPQYYVLDGAGTLRFVSSLDDLRRHVATLEAADEDVTARR